MIKRIKILDDAQYDDSVMKRLHFSECTPSRLNILFGGNGSGKTTLLRSIESALSCDRPQAELILDDGYEIMLHKYYNGVDNFKNNTPSPNAKDYVTQLAQRMHSQYISEGQGIIYTFTNIFHKIDEAIKANPDKHHVVLLDEMDSGLSADHINVVMHIISDMLAKNVQIFVATNMYHWAYTYKLVLSMYTGEFIDISSYEQYFRLQMDMQQKVGIKSDYNFFG